MKFHVNKSTTTKFISIMILAHHFPVTTYSANFFDFFYFFLSLWESCSAIQYSNIKNIHNIGLFSGLSMSISEKLPIPNTDLFLTHLCYWCLIVFVSTTNNDRWEWVKMGGGGWNMSQGMGQSRSFWLTPWHLAHCEPTVLFFGLSI